MGRATRASPTSLCSCWFCWFSVNIDLDVYVDVDVDLDFGLGHQEYDGYDGNYGIHSITDYFVVGVG